MCVVWLRGFFFRIPADAVRTRVDEAEEFVVLCCLDDIHLVAMFAFDLNRPFHNESFEEQFVA